MVRFLTVIKLEFVITSLEKPNGNSYFEYVETSLR